MLTLTAQSQLADALGQMMRSWTLAATRPWTDSALRGLSLWSALMLAPGAGRPDLSDGARPVRGAGYGSFSSYRSGGGHAAAQVVVPGEDAALGFGASGLTPIYHVLDAWRAAFGAGKRS